MEISTAEKINMKHSYIRYAAVLDGDYLGRFEGIFEFDLSFDENEDPEKYFTQWCFDPEIVDDCGYADRDSLECDIKMTNCPAKIKKYKITVEELSDEG